MIFGIGVRMPPESLSESNRNRCPLYSGFCKDLLGYEPTEILGRKLLDLMPPNEAERVVKIMADYYERGELFIRFENITLHKD